MVRTNARAARTCTSADSAMLTRTPVRRATVSTSPSVSRPEAARPMVTRRDPLPFVRPAAWLPVTWSLISVRPGIIALLHARHCAGIPVLYLIVRGRMTALGQHVGAILPRVMFTDAVDFNSCAAYA